MAGLAVGAIYLIRNSINGKCYIGQTTKKNPVARWKQHIRSAKYAANSDILFYRAIRKYGADAFVFETVVSNVPVALLDDLETNCIAAYDGYTEGYNTLKYGSSVRGYTHSDALKAHWSATRKGAIPHNKGMKCPEISGANNSRAIPVICITTGKLFGSGAEAADYYKLTASSITATCKGRRKTTNGLVFEYADLNLRPNIVRAHSTIGGLNTNARAVVCVTTGIEYGSIVEAAKAINASWSGVKSVCSNKRNSVYGYKFKYKD